MPRWLHRRSPPGEDELTPPHSTQARTRNTISRQSQPSFPLALFKPCSSAARSHPVGLWVACAVLSIAAVHACLLMLLCSLTRLLLVVHLCLHSDHGQQCHHHGENDKATGKHSEQETNSTVAQWHSVSVGSGDEDRGPHHCSPMHACMREEQRRMSLPVQPRAPRRAASQRTSTKGETQRMAA